MKKAAVTKPKLEIRVVRGGAMSDEELRQALNVDPDHHILRGVREVLDRLDEHYDAQFASIEASPQERADAGILKAAVRDVRRGIETWNQAGKRDGQ